MLSREFLLKRGHCCYLGCFNCPYNDDPEGLTKEPEDAKIEANKTTSEQKDQQ